MVLKCGLDMYLTKYLYVGNLALTCGWCFVSIDMFWMIANMLLIYVVVLALKGKNLTELVSEWVTEWLSEKVTTREAIASKNV